MNKKKKHQKLRLRAEALMAERVVRRRARKLEEMERDRVVAAVLRGGGLPENLPDGLEINWSHWACMENLMRLAHVSNTQISRVSRLYRALAWRCAAWATVDNLPWYLLLARVPWVGEPESLQLRGGSVRRKRRAVVEHLFCRYSVPTFLLNALDVELVAVARVPVEHDWVVKLVSALGRGCSIRKLPGGTLLPTPLTRKMMKTFLSSPADLEPIVALRRAQVLGLGGSEELVERLMKTRLRTIQLGEQSQEGFWHQVIGWVVARKHLARAAVNELEGFFSWAYGALRSAVAKGSAFRIKGRSEAFLLQQARYYADLSQASEWLSCGIAGEAQGEQVLVEIRTRVSLREEGRKMSNCVGEYFRLVRSGKVAIFVLRDREKSAVMIEVCPGTREILQVKGKANRLVYEQHLPFIKQWASANNLSFLDTALT